MTTFYISFLLYLSGFIVIAQTDYSLFPLKEMPKDFFSSTYNCAKYFCELQMQAIEYNVERFVQKIDNDVKQLIDLQYHVAKIYINKYKVKPIDSSREIIGDNKLQVIIKFNNIILNKKMNVYC